MGDEKLSCYDQNGTKLKITFESGLWRILDEKQLSCKIGFVAWEVSNCIEALGSCHLVQIKNST